MRRWGGIALVACALLLTLVGPVPAANATKAGVVKAQHRLNALHCDAGPVDGKLGTWTRSAVIRFQSRHGLPQSGKLTATTRKRLYADNARRCDRRPVPAHSGKGRRILISQRQNWLWVINSLNKVVAQGGIVDNPGVLHRGSYKTGSYCGRSARVKLNRSGSLWLDNFVRFAPCGIGFHRIPRHMSNGLQMHADHILGTNLATSHGCIRVSKAMSTRLWNATAGRRTAVRVV
jgi:peptidoglycan hydrolase-like protein with peptidoglycan-binding domain